MPPGRTRRALTCAGLALLIVVLLGAGAVILMRQLLSAPTAEVQANAALYDEVVRLIETGQAEWQPHSGGSFTLPVGYQHLSSAEDGEILISQFATGINVYFYPRGQWVYIYSSQDNIGRVEDCSSPERDRPHWFWVQCYWRNP